MAGYNVTSDHYIEKPLIVEEGLVDLDEIRKQHAEEEAAEEAGEKKAGGDKKQAPAKNRKNKGAAKKPVESLIASKSLHCACPDRTAPVPSFYLPNDFPYELTVPRPRPGTHHRGAHRISQPRRDRASRSRTGRRRYRRLIRSRQRHAPELQFHPPLGKRFPHSAARSRSCHRGWPRSDHSGTRRQFHLHRTGTGRYRPQSSGKNSRPRLRSQPRPAGTEGRQFRHPCRSSGARCRQLHQGRRLAGCLANRRQRRRRFHHSGSAARLGEQLLHPRLRVSRLPGERLTAVPAPTASPCP